MATKAGIFNGGGGLRLKHLCLARELREEEGIAAGETHGRAAPRAIRRDIDQLIAGAALGHIELQPGATGAVAAETLVGGEKLVCSRALAGLGPDMVVGLRRHGLDLGARGSTARYLECLEKIRIVGGWHPFAPRRLRLRRPFAAKQLPDAVLRTLPILAEKREGLAGLPLNVSWRCESRILRR